MSNMEILFLSPRTGLTSPPGEGKHEPSIARSHAARVSQNKSKRKTAKEKTTTTPTTTTQISIPVLGNQVLALSLVTKSISPPLSPLFAGNSDPFASQSIQVTPRANELIRFFSSFYASKSFQRNLSRTKFLSDFIDRTISLALQAPCSTHAFLYSLSTLRSCLMPENLEFQQEKERLNKEVSLALQTQMKTQGRNSSNVLMALKFCFIAAAFDGNIIEATMHGTLLKCLMVRKWHAGDLHVDLYDFIHATYVDGQLALKYLTHTIFEMGWIDKVCEPISLPAEKLLAPLLPTINADLHDSIDDPPLLSIVTRARVTRYMLSRPMQDTSEAHCLDVWLGLESATLQARVANYYYMVQRQLSAPELTTADRFTWLTRGAVALAMAIVVNTPESMTLYKIQVPGGDKVIARLREILSEIPTAASCLAPGAVAKYDLVHLWVYFVCAQNEQRALQEQNPLPLCHLSPTTFFTRIFAAQTRRMHLLGWDQVQVLIRRIVYFDVLSPNGAQWVDQAINHFVGENDANELASRQDSSYFTNTVSAIISLPENQLGSPFQLP